MFLIRRTGDCLQVSDRQRKKCVMLAEGDRHRHGAGLSASVMEQGNDANPFTLKSILLDQAAKLLVRGDIRMSFGEPHPCR